MKNNRINKDAKLKDFFFQHDFNALNDEKIIKLRIKYGMQGYGIYFAILELLAQNNGILELNYDTIKYRLQDKTTIIKSVIEDFGLFEIENDYFFSKRLKKHIAEILEQKEQSSKNGMIGNLIKINPEKYQKNALNKLTYEKIRGLLDAEIGKTPPPDRPPTAPANAYNIIQDNIIQDNIKENKINDNYVEKSNFSTAEPESIFLKFADNKLYEMNIAKAKELIEVDHGPMIDWHDIQYVLSEFQEHLKDNTDINKDNIHKKLVRFYWDKLF